MTELRNARYLSVHDLRRRINEGDVDTVLVAFTDLQGRLQGERVHATYFAEHVLDQGIAAPGYLLAVDLDMNIADPRRPGRGADRPGDDTGSGFANDSLAATPAWCRVGAVRCGRARPNASRAITTGDLDAATRGRSEPGISRLGEHRVGVHDLQQQLRGGPERSLS